MQISAEFLNFEAVYAKLDSKTLLDPPLRTMLDAIGKTITTFAAVYAPIWETGSIGSSRFHEIEHKGDTWTLAFGFKKETAVFLEYGTGLLAEGPGPRKGRAHFPPPKALDQWAKAHGWPNGWVLSQHIGKRGGLRPRYFLRDAKDEEMARVDSRLSDLGNAVVRIWDA